MVREDLRLLLYASSAVRLFSYGQLVGPLREEDHAAHTNFLREPQDMSPVAANPHAALRLLLAFRRHAR